MVIRVCLLDREFNMEVTEITSAYNLPKSLGFIVHPIERVLDDALIGRRIFNTPLYKERENRNRISAYSSIV